MPPATFACVSFWKQERPQETPSGLPGHEAATRGLAVSPIKRHLHRAEFSRMRFLLMAWDFESPEKVHVVQV